MKAYANEIKYSHLEDMRSVLATAIASDGYEVDGAASAFERQVQSDLAAAREAHLNDELGIAIRGYTQLQALILKTAHPTLPVQVTSHPLWEVAYEPGLLTSFIAMAAESASRTRPPLSAVPSGVVWPVPLDTQAVVTRPELLDAGTASSLDVVRGVLSAAAGAVVAGDFKAAVSGYTRAIRAVGDNDPTLTAHLHQDLGLVLERSGNADAAQGQLQTAQELFTKVGSGEGQVSSLAALSGLLTRQGQVGQGPGGAEPGRRAQSQAGHPRARHRRRRGRRSRCPPRSGPVRGAAATPRGRAAALTAAPNLPQPISQAATPTLQALAYVGDVRSTDVFTVVGAGVRHPDRPHRRQGRQPHLAVRDDGGHERPEPAVRAGPAGADVRRLPAVHLLLRHPDEPGRLLPGVRGLPVGRGGLPERPEVPVPQRERRGRPGLDQARPDVRRVGRLGVPRRRRHRHGVAGGRGEVPAGRRRRTARSRPPRRCTPTPASPG